MPFLKNYFSWWYLQTTVAKKCWDEFLVDRVKRQVLWCGFFKKIWSSSRDNHGCMTMKSLAAWRNKFEVSI